MLVFGGVTDPGSAPPFRFGGRQSCLRLSADSVQNDVREGRSINEAMRDAARFPGLDSYGCDRRRDGRSAKMLNRVSDQS